MNVCQPEIESLVAKGKPFVIDPEQVQDGRVEIVDMKWIADGGEPEIVSLPIAGPCSDTTTGHEHGSALGVVISTVAAL